MARGLIRHAEVGRNKPSSVRGLQNTRSWSFIKTLRLLLVSFHSFDNFFTDDETVNDNRQSDQERDNSRHPDASEYLRRLRRNSNRDSLHKNKQKYRHLASIGSLKGLAHGLQVPAARRTKLYVVTLI